MGPCIPYVFFFLSAGLRGRRNEPQALGLCLSISVSLGGAPAWAHAIGSPGRDLPTQRDPARPTAARTSGSSLQAVDTPTVCI